jgi:hypothetical protein
MEETPMVSTGQPPTTPQPAAAPPTKSGPWTGLLIGCLAFCVVVLLAAAGIGLAVWRPWEKKGPDHPPAVTDTTGTYTDATDDDLDVDLADLTAEDASASGASDGPAFLTINAANAEANGATFKLFCDDGTALDSGVLPASVSVPADSRCKLVVSKSGYKPWEDWQAAGAAGSSQDVSVLLEEQPPNTVTVSICAATGKKANQWCPTTTRKDFRKGGEPATCTVHKPPPGKVSVRICTASKRRANQWCPTAVALVFDANRVPGYCTAHKAPQNTVSVTICTATGRKANQWCPSTASKTFTTNSVPSTCTTHSAPPPQNTITMRICTATGQKAGQHCPDTAMRTVPRSQAPALCATHAAPPPKPPTTAQQYKWCPQCNARNRVNGRLCRKCNYRF